MKAYKGSYNGKCQTLKFEVGKTYTFDGKLRLCKQGFHFCKNPTSVLTYYPYTKEFVLFEIEVLGDVIDNWDKSVTNKLKVIRIIPPNEYPKLLNITLDDNGNLIHFADSHGFEECCEYDQNENLIYSKETNEIEKYEQWYKYDDKENLISYKNSTGNNWKIIITTE